MRRYLRTAAALCLALCLSLALLPAPAHAEEPETAPEEVQAPEEERTEALEEGIEETPAEETEGAGEEPPAPGEEDPAGETGEEPLEEVWEEVTAEDPFPDLDATHLTGGGASFFTVNPSSAQWEQMKIQLRDNIKAGTGKATVTNLLGSSFTADDISALYFNTLYDYPEETYFACTAYQSNYSYNSSGIIDIEIYYDRISGYNPSAYKAAVDAAAAECFTAGMTDLEKVVAAHDWIVTNCQYDPYVGNNDTVITANNVTYGEDPKVYTSYGVFVDGNAVCQGYALALKVLLDRVNIPCCYVSSKTMGHGWNMVNLGGNWYHVDATHDDPAYGVTHSDNTMIYADVPGYVRRSKFILSDSGAEKEGYRGWTTEFGYTCPAEYTRPAALSGAANTAAYLHNGAFYLLGADGDLKRYPVGNGFQSGVEIASGITSFGNNIAGVFDRKAGMMYFRAYQYDSGGGSIHRIYSVNIYGTMSSNTTYKTKQLPLSGVGLKLAENGSVLCLWYGYSEYGRMTVANMDSTETTGAIPIAICYYPAAQTLAGLSSADLALNLGSGGHAGTLYAAVYAEDGRLLRIAALASFTASEKGQKTVDGGKINTTGADSAKLLVVGSGAADSGKPLAMAFESTRNAA